MTELAASPLPSGRSGLRASYSALGEPPPELFDFSFAASLLAPLQLGAFVKLVRALWQQGSLPVGLKAIAKKAGVGPRTFEKMAPELEPLFDRDHHGRWRNLDLEAERTMRLGREPDTELSVDGAAPRRVVNPDLSAKRSAAAKKRNEVYWSSRRAQLQLLEGGLADGSQNATAIAKEVANPVANGEAASDETLVVDFGVLRSFATASASGAPGLSDRLFDSQAKERIEESDGRTDAPGADAVDRKFEAAEAVIDRKSAMSGTVEGTGGPSQTAPPPIANGSATTIASAVGAVASLPYTVGEALIGNAGAAPAAPVPSDAAIIAALREACGAKLPPHRLTPDGVAPIRDLLNEGCDFMRDVVPAFAAGICGLKSPLKSLRASYLHDMARANRDEAARARSRMTDEAARHHDGKVFVEEGSPPWRAWLKAKGVTSYMTFLAEDRKRRGWRFPSLWPPGWDEARLATVEAAGG